MSDENTVVLVATFTAEAVVIKAADIEAAKNTDTENTEDES